MQWGIERSFVGLDEQPSPAQTIRMLRISVTDRCNLRCLYCMPEQGISKLLHNDLLSLEELSRVAAWLCRQLNIERVKLTGGEPLVRSGIDHLIRRLNSIDGVREISMTTNGTLLGPRAEELKAAGLRRVNISLDTLDPVWFSMFTRGGDLQAALDGISAAIASGLHPVKLNAVLQRSTWQQDVPALLDFASSLGVELRFIELMRTGTEHLWCAAEYLAASEVRQWLQVQQTNVIPVSAVPNAPADVTLVHWSGTTVRIGWITPVSHPFCSRCERLRLDARGRVFRCLMDSSSLPLAQILQTQGEEAAFMALTAYLAGKSAPTVMEKDNAMCVIGG